MGSQLTMHRSISDSHDNGVVTQYTVSSPPVAFIRLKGRAWKILKVKPDEHLETLEGEYSTAEEALAALQQEIDSAQHGGETGQRPRTSDLPHSS